MFSVKPKNNLFGSKMRKPFTLARVALYSYATVSLVIFCLLVIAQSILSFLVFAAITISLIAVADALSKDKKWAKVCSYIIFVGIAVLTVPILLMSVNENELMEIIWPQAWTLLLLILGLYSLIMQKPIKSD